MNYIETCTKIAVFLWRSSNYRPLTSVLHVRPGWIIYQNMRETWEKKVMKFEREIPIGLMHGEKNDRGGLKKPPPPMGLGLRPSKKAEMRHGCGNPTSISQGGLYITLSQIWKATICTSVVPESKLSNPSPSPSHHLWVRVITPKSESESSPQSPSPRVSQKNFKSESWVQ